ncbi:hypothetical protein ABZS66_15705 [Dactylosporangium sp. NPDC005572]|uniref:hypothetical protein n=1 Tax=Dactylosporangium sp. NPDC005572 TaxID=3156889 RepID=UPI0033AD8D50
MHARMTSYGRLTRRLARSCALAAVVGCALLLQGCFIASSLRSEVFVQDIEWLADGSRYFIREQGFDAHPEVWQMKEDGGSRKILAEVPDACDVGRGNIEFLTTLATGQLAVGVECNDGRIVVYAFNAATKRLSRIIAFDNARRVAFGAHPDDGYVMHGDFPCFRVMPFQGGVIVDSDLSVRSPVGTWFLRDGYNGTRNCPSTGDVGDPVWSRRGGFVSFLLTSSPITAGRSAEASYGYAWNVALAREQSSTLELVGPDIEDAAALAVSPDGTQIAVGTRYGMVLVDVKTGAARHLVDSVRVFDVAYSPDGKQIAYIDTEKTVQTIHID